MLRKVVCTLVGLGMVGVLAAPAGAVGGPNGPVGGPFTGTTSYTFQTDGCSFVHQVYDGTVGAAKQHASSFHLEGCVDATGSSFPYTGTFTVRAAGGTLTGTVTGLIQSTTSCAPIHFTLTVTGGTGRFHATGGTITVDGEWRYSGQVPATNDPIDGTVTASLTR